MLDLIAKQYKLSEEIELLISDYLIGSTEYYKNLQLQINKNIIDINRLSIYIENNEKYNLFKKYINKLKYYFLDLDLIMCKINIFDHFILCDIELNNNISKIICYKIKKNISKINPKFNMNSIPHSRSNRKYIFINF